MDAILLTDVDDLRDVIAWSKENGGLTTAHRIMIHQEIAKLLREEESGEAEETKLPEFLQEKAFHIHCVIKFNNWNKQEIKY